LVINALRKTSHVSHFTLEEALEIIDKIQPKKAYITHISHQMGLHSDVQKELPSNVFLAYDGLEIEIQ
jgi:phosphoribosyl 1,2-cyclic phosphate phosphodiesterase